MLTPHVTSTSGLPSAHACEQEHTAPGSDGHRSGERSTSDIKNSLNGDRATPAEYFRSAEPE